MKKLILVASIALAFASCNTEEPLDSQETAIVAKAPSNERATAAAQGIAGGAGALRRGECVLQPGRHHHHHVHRTGGRGAAAGDRRAVVITNFERVITTPVFPA